MTAAVVSGCSTETKTEYAIPDCSQSYPNGACATGQACFQGACVAAASLCSPTNLSGTCGSGMSCYAGGCVLSTALCSSGNPAGACDTGSTCMDGVCKATASLCSASNPGGLCAAGLVCMGGECSTSVVDPCSVRVYTAQPTIGVRTAVTGTASATATANAVVAGNTIAVGGVTFTAVAADATPTNVQFAIGATDTATATNIAAALNANTTVNALVVASANAAVVTLTAKVAGAGGNGIALTGTSPRFTMSSAVLAGGHGGGKAAITVDGLQFKDSNGNGTLEPFEDWRLSESCRAKDLVSRLALDQKAGVMWAGGPLGNGNADASIPANVRTALLGPNFQRFSLIRLGSAVTPTQTAAYTNAVQEFAEAQPIAVPAVFNADPSHFVTIVTNSTTGSQLVQSLSGSNPSGSLNLLSYWPLPLGLGAAQDQKLTTSYGETVRKEFMAMGMRWQLGPMVDFATEPRWDRVQTTFGEGLGVVGHARACITAFQNSNTGDIRNGIAATAKHFPGAGTDQDGMDSHNWFGQYNVYPGNNFAYHLQSFQAAFDVGVAATMACYSVFPNDRDPENVASGFSYSLITKLAKQTMGFRGMVTGDWGTLTNNFGALSSMTLPERAAMWVKAGSNQFGSDDGKNFAYAVTQGLLTEAEVDVAAAKVLEMSFKLGVFENPYVDATPAVVNAIVRTADTVKKGFDAQKRAIVLLKNGQTNATAPLPINGTRAACDSNGDGTVTVYFDGEKDVLAGSDALSTLLGGDYDYTSAAGTGVMAVAQTTDIATADIAILRVQARRGIRADSGEPLSFDGPFPGTLADTSIAGSIMDRNRIINAMRVRDGYTRSDGTVVAASNPKLKIVVVMHMWRPGIVKPFINGLKTLDETLGQASSYPLVSQESNINPSVVATTVPGAHAGIDGFLVDFGAFDRAVLDFVFNKNIPANVTNHGLARLPMEIPSTDAEVTAQYEDVPADTVHPTFKLGDGITLQ